jgi:hypothetical protein
MRDGLLESRRKIIAITVDWDYERAEVKCQ